jgi:outer membrane protein assembly factor BamB
MMQTPKLPALLGLTWGLMWGLTLQADDAALAKHLIALADRTECPRGVCVVPEGGALALALAQNSEFIVVSQEPDAARMQAASAAADKSGLLGRRLYLAESPVEKIVVADHYANLLVATGVTDATLGEWSAPDVMRKLTPHGGKAVVGGKVTETALRAWAKDAEVVTDAFGTWAIIERPALPNSAEWTHRFFDSSFNPVSTDTAFVLPSMTQWLDTPYNHGAGYPLMAGGRLLMVMEGKYPGFPRPQCDVNWLIMRDAYNGRILWKRDLGDGIAADWLLSACVLTADSLYLIEFGTPNVLVLDPATGRERRRIDCSALGGMVKWIALRDGLLFVAVGAKEEDTAGGFSNLGMSAAQHLKFIRVRNGGSDEEDNARLDRQANCRMIAAFQSDTGNLMWRHAEDADCIPECLIAVRDGRVYFMARGKYAAALEARTGSVLWKNPEAARVYKESLWPQFSVGSGALEASESTILFARPGSARIALDAPSGKLLWTTPKYGAHQQAGSLIWGNSVLGAKSVDLRTGQLKWDENSARDDKGNPYRGICTFGTASGRYFVGSSAAPAFDLLTMSSTRRGSIHKSPCSIGAVIGEGILFQSSFHCACSYLLNGNIVEMSGDGRQYQKSAAEAQRLRVAAKDALPAALGVTPKDWPAFRAGNDRANRSRAETPASAVSRWTWTPSTPYVNPPFPSDLSVTSFEPVQPICAGDRVFIGGPDGAVRCVELATGRPVWVFYTGGQLFSSPAVWDDRLYAGSGDGYLYCLEAATGRELWRFQAAPAERRIMAYGHLVSTWPVAAGVLVQDGVVYLAASLLYRNATHVYALESKSGRIIWQDNTSGLPQAEIDAGVTAVGTMTVARGRLWIRGTSWDIKTGECRLTPGATQTPFSDAGQRGMLQRNTGALAGGKFLLFGGRRSYDSQSRPQVLARSPTTLYVLELDEQGAGIGNEVGFFNGNHAFAAWDERQMAVAPLLEDNLSVNATPRHAPILCWDTTKMCDFVRAKRSEKKPPTTDWSFETIATAAAHQWLLDSHRAYAVALSENAVVAALGTAAPAEMPGKGIMQIVPTSWCVVALDRATGNAMWTQPLPSEPVMDGLCIARDGSVVAQLLDGSVACLGEE